MYNFLHWLCFVWFEIFQFQNKKPNSRKYKLLNTATLHEQNLTRNSHLLVFSLVTCKLGFEQPSYELRSWAWLKLYYYYYFYDYYYYLLSIEGSHLWGSYLTDPKKVSDYQE